MVMSPSYKVSDSGDVVVVIVSNVCVTVMFLSINVVVCIGIGMVVYVCI